MTRTIISSSLRVSGERKIDKERKRDHCYRIERSFGSFSRTYTLPATVDPNTVEAKYENGVLHVKMTKRAETRPRQIKINEAKEIAAKVA
jgi:HSP20 family protein